MTESRDKDHGAAMNADYPFGIIGAAIAHTVAMTVITYVLYVVGTYLGLSVVGDDWDIVEWLDLGAALWILLVPVYVLLATLAGYVSVLLTLMVIMALWVWAVYSESVKARVVLLLTIFALAFANAWYVASA